MAQNDFINGFYEVNTDEQSPVENVSGFGYYKKCLQHYADFSGRARRKEFWTFFLFNMIFAFATAIIDNVLGTTFKISSYYGEVSAGYGWIYLLYCLAVFIPGLAVGVRRLHDVGKSGWFYLIALIPILGGIWLLILVCTEGQIGDNQYGRNPKA